MDLNLVDLSQPLNANSPTWDGGCGFRLSILKDYDQTFKNHYLEMEAGVGTHMDAPAHRFPNAASIHQIPLSQLFCPACILDVRQQAHADYEISVKDLEEYEGTHGKIPQNALVIGFTGWSRYWNDSKRYSNVDSVGVRHFPAFSEESIQFLLKRQISGIGIDTLSPDCRDLSFPVHRLMLGAGKYIIENIADCSPMPRKGGFALALPLNIEATEAPMRLIGMYEKK